MNIVGTAPVPGITRHLHLVKPIEQHPVWCLSVDDDSCGGDHLGRGVNIPATDGGFEITDSGALFPRIEVAPTSAGGVPAANLALFDPTAGDYEWAEVRLPLDDARTFAAGFSTPSASTACLRGGSAAAAVEVDSVRLSVADNGRRVSVTLKRSEADQLAAALVWAADVVEGLAEPVRRAA